MALTGVAEPNVLKRLRIESDVTFSEDLGAFGESVPPRAGEVKRSKQDKEDYCLRRLLIAMHEVGKLPLPMDVFCLKRATGAEKWPDFVLYSEFKGYELGIEITEATDENYQEQLSAEAKAASNLEDGTGVTFIGPDDGWVGDEPERRALRDFVRAISNKLVLARRGRYAATPDCDLLVYDNTETGWLSNRQAIVNDLRSRCVGGKGHGGFRQIHLIMGQTVWLDALGERLRPVDLSRNYDSDFAGWAMGQAELARQAGGQGLDLPNLAEELESLGKSQRQKRDSHLRILLLHLLKWRYQPDRRSQSWRESIVNSRREIEDVSEMSPSLDLISSRRDDPDAVLTKQYDRARRDAARETGLPIGTFPEKCPFALDDILDLDFLPDEQGGSECG